MTAALTAISPIDGRYRGRTAALRDYFSELALIRYRVRIEVEWYLSLAANPAIDALPALSAATIRRIRALYTEFSIADARRVKAIERETNHDVKAVEYFVKERLAAIESGAAGRDGPLRLHVGGYQQPRLCIDSQGIRRARTEPEARRC